MNNKLLVQRSINFSTDYIEFLHFLHPNFEIINDLSSYDNPYPNGIIYRGQWYDKIVSDLNRITPNWIIVNAHHFDLDLTTNEGLFKNLLPLHYAKIRSSLSKDESPVYDNMSYDLLLEKIKACLICNNFSILEDDSTNSSVYSLYKSILATSDVLSSVYFNTITRENISRVTSAVLSFLSKVQTNNVRYEKNVYYARLISQSNKRYGKRIQKAICRFIKSKAAKEVSLYNLLLELNRAK
jgi:hypothetical protein